ncbi:hypothetical protein [Saccharothrix deserti]|uniref:hypothetical protein n=1 Tax=Saccharothrix deserti TaxID=2593674 RepID=UPI00131D8959|nr:hypothetical protein [Saccharothrix deserti]
MPVNGPNEWSALRTWLADRVARPIDLAGFAELDRVRLTRSLAAVTRTLGEGHVDESHVAAAVVRGELDHGGSPRANDLLRSHLATALAARTAEVRSITPDGGLAVTDRHQLAECRALADEILALSPDPELIAFAVDLQHRLDRAQRWRWVEPDVWTAAVVALAVLVLPFVGSAIDNPVVTAAGVLVGGALVFGFVMTHRKPQWAVDADTAFRRPRP